MSGSFSQLHHFVEEYKLRRLHAWSQLHHNKLQYLCCQILFHYHFLSSWASLQIYFKLSWQTFWSKMQLRICHEERIPMCTLNSHQQSQDNRDSLSNSCSTLVVDMKALVGWVFATCLPAWHALQSFSFSNFTSFKPLTNLFFINFLSELIPTCVSLLCQSHPNDVLVNKHVFKFASSDVKSTRYSCCI